MAGLNTDLGVLYIPVSGALTANEPSLAYPVPFGAEVTKAVVNVGTAPAGADLLVDIQVNGTTVNTVTVADGTTSGEVNITSGPQAGDPNVVTGPTVKNGTDYIGPVYPGETPVAVVQPGDVVSAVVTQVGSTTAGSDAVVALVLDRK